MLHYPLRLLLVLAIGVLSGCASVQMTTPEDDTRAKSFSAAPGKANIYVYRNETFGAALSMPVSLDGRIAGNTASKSYFLFEVPPGTYTITSHTEDTPTLKVAAQAGRNYFVWQEVKMGMFQGRAALHLVDDATGRAGVMECKRIQSSF